MSYVRFSSRMRDGRRSDVYVYASVYGHLECCACRLTNPDDSEWHGNFRCTSALGMIGHLKAHRAAGHAVPQWAFTRLRKATP